MVKPEPTLGPKQCLVLVNQLLPQMLADVEEDPEELLKRSDAEVCQKLVEALKKPVNGVKIDYLSPDDLMSNDQNALDVLQALYKPRPDYSAYDVLPQRIVEEYLRQANPLARDLLAPEELVKEIKQLRPDLEYLIVPETIDIEDELDAVLTPLANALPALKKAKVDSFDVLTIPDARMLVASELVKSLSKQTPEEQLRIVNELLDKLTGGRVFVDSLDQLKDGKIIAQLLMAANLTGRGLEKFTDQDAQKLQQLLMSLDPRSEADCAEIAAILNSALQYEPELLTRPSYALPDSFKA